MMKFVVCAALCFTAVFAQVEQCPSGLPTATSFEVVGCDAPPCGLVDGSDATVRIGFVSPTDTNTLTAHLQIIWNGIEMDYDLGDQTNACNGIEGGCPLSAGSSYMLESTVAVNSPFDTNEDITLRLNAADDSGENVLCGQLDTTLIAG